MRKRGKFIVFEGLDGSGKTTQCRMLAERLTALNIPHFATQQQSGNPVGLLISQAFRKEFPIETEALALLFASDRYQHVFTEIIPALERGEHVLCDRYYYSSLAYQGMDSNDVYAYNKKVIDRCKPDITFFIDVSPEECMNRINARGSKELYESLEEQQRVRESYMKAFDRLRKTDRVVVINGKGLTPEEAAGKVWEHAGIETLN